MTVSVNAGLRFHEIINDGEDGICKRRSIALTASTLASHPPDVHFRKVVPPREPLLLWSVLLPVPNVFKHHRCVNAEIHGGQIRLHQFHSLAVPDCGEGAAVLKRPRMVCIWMGRFSLSTCNSSLVARALPACQVRREQSLKAGYQLGLRQSLNGLR